VEPLSHCDEFCPHCRAERTHVLGTCSVCDRTVCRECGNVQYSAGERSIVHRECLKNQSDDGFTMIKFVR